jgi:hypothetical protein
MRRIRIAWMAAAATLALCALAAASATPALAFPHFTVPNDPFTSTSGTSIASSSGFTITCTSDKMSGETAATNNLLNVATFILEGCSRPCPGSLGFETKGELGEVEVSEATSKIGILFVLNATFMCGTTPVQIKGNVAAEVAEPKTTKEFIFALNSSLQQKIKKIHLKSGWLTTGLTINGFPATYQSSESNAFKTTVETAP